MASRGGSPRGRRVAAASEPQQLRRESGPQTGKGVARRAELLVAARRVFERRGFIDARVADIVAEARVAQGTFYSYFDSKDTIFRVVAERVVEQMLEDFDADGPATSGGSTYDRVRAGLQRYVDIYRRDARIIALMEQVGTFTPEMRTMRLQVREAFLARIERGVKRQQAEGVADPGLDPQLMVQVLGAMVEHTCYVWLTLGKEFDEHELVEAMTLVWARAIGVADPSAWRPRNDPVGPVATD